MQQANIHSQAKLKKKMYVVMGQPNHVLTFMNGRRTAE